MDALRLHYALIGTLRRDQQGRPDNAVLLLHTTGGSSRQLLSPTLMAALFAPGCPLDARTHFVIIPDAIGHGASARPSDGLRARFPAYDYADMVAAQYRLLTETLEIDRLRLTLGISMGGMHVFLWGVTHPGFSRALMPMASLPTPIAGLNRVHRKLMIAGQQPLWTI